MKRIGSSGGTPSNHQINQQRQENVKVLFHGKRPKVAIGSRKVALEEKEVMQKWCKDGDWAVVDEAKEQGEQYEGIEGRIDFQGASDSEPTKANRVVLPVLREQQSGN